MKPIAHLGDALVMLALLFALALGADVRWIVGIVLALTVLAELAKAFSAFCEPIVKTLKGRYSP